MKCGRCEEYRETVGDVRGCVQCIQDHTARQIPADVPYDTPLAKLCVPDSGLANRFAPGSAPPVDAEPIATAEPPAKPAPAARAKPGPKPGSHNKSTSKKK